MAASCSLYPQVENNKGKMVDSKLFKDLLSLTNNRDLTKAIWATVHTPSLMRQSGFNRMAEDENGEPTIDAVREAFGLDEILDDNTKAELVAKELGINNDAGMPVQFDNSVTAIDKALEFNERQNGAIADVEMVDKGKYEVHYDNKSVDGEVKAKELRFKKDLNNRLTAKLNRIGIDVGFTNDPRLNGVFDPLNAEKNADGLITMIKVANNELGEAALPEEFAHLIVRGLRDNVFADRIRKVLTPEAVKEYLGDRYEQYRQEYSNGQKSVEEYLQEEVMGQILAESLKGGNLEGIFERFWNVAKEKFTHLTEDEIRADIDAARKAVENLTQQIMEEDDLGNIVDMDFVRADRALFSLVNEIKTLREAAEEGEKILAKKYSLDNKMQWSTADSRKAAAKAIDRTRAVLSQQNQEVFAISRMLGDMTEQMNLVKNRLIAFANTRKNAGNTIEDIANACRAIVQFGQFSGEYKDWIALIATNQSNENLRKEFGPHGEKIGEIARKVLELYNDIATQYSKLRYDTLFALIARQVGGVRAGMNQMSPAEFERFVEGIMHYANNDIGFIDANISSIANSSSPILAITHNMVTTQQAIRDRRISAFVANIKGYEEALQKSDAKNSFMIERNAKGDKTGYMISKWDLTKFEEERNALIERLEADDTLDEDEKEGRLAQWMAANTKVYSIFDQNGNEITRETLPRLDEDGGHFSNKNFDKIVNTKAKKDYYYAALRMKHELDTYLPAAPNTIFFAPQTRGGLADQFDGSTKITPGSIYKAVMKEYIRDNDETEYGEIIKTKTGDKTGRVVGTDLNGVPLRKVPVYFVHKLNDMSQLNTDFTQSLSMYAAMAINFQEMDKINDIMVLMNEYLNSDEFNVQDTKGSSKVWNVFSSRGKDYVEPVRKKKHSIAEAHTQFLRTNLWGESRNDLGTATVDVKGKKKLIDWNSADKMLSNWMTKVALGYNVFSALSNLTQGEHQMLVEAMGGRYYNVKDLAKAHAEFYKLNAEYIAELGKPNKKNKLYHMLRAFNAKEDFFRSVTEEEYKKNIVRKFMGGMNSQFMQSWGEHVLHAIPMIATLMHTKVKIKTATGFKDGNLYDQIEVRKYHDAHNPNVTSYYLVIKEGTYIAPNNEGKTNEMNDYIQTINGQKLIDIGDKGPVNNQVSDRAIVNMNLVINQVNRRVHGGYNPTEKGGASHGFFARYLMRFRQWMPGTYGNRWSFMHKGRFNALTGEYEKGFYIDWFSKLARDLKHGHFNLKLQGQGYSASFIENIKRARAEMILVLFQELARSLTETWRDTDNPWLKRMIAYQLIRLNTETLAMTPNYKILNAIWAIAKQPMAGVDTLMSLTNLINVSDMWHRIDRGQYDGWTKWERSALEVMPYKNIYKAIEFKDENYIFNAYVTNN